MSNRIIRSFAGVVMVLCVSVAASAQESTYVVTQNILAQEFDLGGAAVAVKPIKIVAARNGAFSGKAVVVSDKAIAGPSAKMSDLTSPAGAIPTAAIDVRFAQNPSAATEPWHSFDPLWPTPPATAAVLDKKAFGRNWPSTTVSMGHAMLPVWITVNVPADAKAGDYTGSLDITAGGKTFKVPVEMKLCDWALPAPAKNQMFTELLQSPESVALQYNVPLWSDEHFKLMEKSLQLMGKIGNRTAYIPLICDTNQGNEQTMVRWIKDGDKYQYDFTAMDKYLDSFEKNVGKPQFVIVYVWDTFLETDSAGSDAGAAVDTLRKGESAKGVPVSVIDAVGGKAQTVYLPKYSDPQSVALWEPLMTQLKEHLKKRDMDKAMCLGMVTDIQPARTVVELFKKASPGTLWMRRGHMRIKDVSGVGLVLQESPSYNTWAYDVKDGQHLYGWKDAGRFPGLAVHFPRGGRDNSSRCMFRMMGEINIAGAQRGFGGWGADFWNVLKNKRGSDAGRLASRFSKSSWRNLDIETALLAPGKDGAIATARYEAMREGIQECEARIFIEQALTDPAKKAKLPADLATRCQTILDERLKAIKDEMDSKFGYGGSSWTTVRLEYPKFVDGNWQERSEKLYTAAGEVAAKLK